MESCSYDYDLTKDHANRFKILRRGKDGKLEGVNKNFPFVDFVTTQVSYHKILIFIMHFVRKKRKSIRMTGS